jgi:CBS domain-containing protein/ribosome-associated translation inhibitor RaiA
VSASEILITPEIVATINNKLSDIVGKMKESKQWVVPILKNDKLVAVFSYKDLLGKRVNLETRIINLGKPITTLHKNAEIPKIVAKFYVTKARALPVVDDNKKFLGLITRESLLSYLKSNNLIPDKRAREVMNSPPISIEAEDSVARARWIMIRDNISRLPVMDNNKLVGIVATKDIVDRLYSASGRKKTSILREEERLMAMPVKDIMTYPVITVSGTDNTLKVTNLLLKNNISGAPVLEGDNIVGIVSSIDIISAVAKQYEISMPIEAKLTEDLKNPEIKSMIDGILDRSVSKLERITEIISFNVSFKEEMRSQGKKIYTATARAITKLGNFIARESDWDPVVAVRKAVDILEERILKSLKKIQESKKRAPKEEES